MLDIKDSAVYVFRGKFPWIDYFMSFAHVKEIDR